jgi:hypothetical protein
MSADPHAPWSADKIARARRMVACLRWSEMPGMQFRYRGVGAVTRPGAVGEAFCGGEWPGEPGQWLPDLDDPATLGCIEHGLLPRFGYGRDAHLDCWTGADGEPRWTVVYRPDPVSFPSRVFSVDEDGHTSKAEALLVALEAAP